AVGAEQVAGLVLAEGEALAAGELPVDEGGGGLLVDVVVLGHLAGVGGVPAPLRVLDGVRQRADGAFGGRVGGDEVGALGRRGPSEGAGDGWAVRVPGGGPAVGCGAVLAAAERASARPPSSTWTTRTGLAGAAAAAERRASASAASPTEPSPTAGMAVTTTASQVSSARAPASASWKSAAEAAVVRSRGGCGRRPSARQ